MLIQRREWKICVFFDAASRKNQKTSAILLDFKCSLVCCPALQYKFSGEQHRKLILLVAFEPQIDLYCADDTQSATYNEYINELL